MHLEEHRIPRHPRLAWVACVALVALTTACGAISDAPALPDADIGGLSLVGSRVGGGSVDGFVEPGLATAAAPSPQVRVGGSGTDIWGRSDGFFYAHQEVTGDFILETRVAALEPTDPRAKAGLMIRASLGDDAPNALIASTPKHGVTFQHRAEPGGETTYVSVPASGPVWLRLTRTGDSVEAFYSIDGVEWTRIDEVGLQVPDSFLVGFAVTSRRPGTIAEASFDGVTLDRAIYRHAAAEPAFR